jgi:hypothetical protein
MASGKPGAVHVLAKILRSARRLARSLFQGAAGPLLVSKTNMLLSFVAAVSPFVINLVVQAPKYFTGFSSTAGKRFLLAIASIIGAIAFSALNGTPLDVNSVSSLVQTALESSVAFLAAHGSYSLLTGKTSATELPNA